MRSGEGPLLQDPRPTRAERRAADAEVELRMLDTRAEIDRKRAAYADEQQRRRDDRDQRLKARKAYERGEARARWSARLARWRRTLVLVGAIVGVNVVAVAGQVTAFHDGFGWPLAGALGAAAVVESIAIYVGWHAHIALIEGDSVARLRAASYGIALVVGLLNYHHYAAAWMPSDKAVMFGMASLLSPWLWAIHSRHLHRSQLRQAGLIDPRAPKFSALRWLLHRAETWRALKWAVRQGEQSPTVSILAAQMDQTLADSARYVDRAHARAKAAYTALLRAQGDALAAAELYMAVLEHELAEVSVEASPGEATSAQPADTPAPDPDDESAVNDAASEAAATDAEVEARQDDLADTSATLTADTSNVSEDDASERPDAQDNREAERWIRERMRAGRTPTQADISARYGFSNGWASSRVKAARGALSARGYRFLPGNRVIAPFDADTADTSPNGQNPADAMSGDPS